MLYSGITLNLSILLIILYRYIVFGNLGENRIKTKTNFILICLLSFLTGLVMSNYSNETLDTEKIKNIRELFNITVPVFFLVYFFFENYNLPENKIDYRLLFTVFLSVWVGTLFGFIVTKKKLNKVEMGDNWNKFYIYYIQGRHILDIIYMLFTTYFIIKITKNIKH